MDPVGSLDQWCTAAPSQNSRAAPYSPGGTRDLTSDPSLIVFARFGVVAEREAGTKVPKARAPSTPGSLGHIQSEVSGSLLSCALPWQIACVYRNDALPIGTPIGRNVRRGEPVYGLALSHLSIERLGETVVKEFSNLCGC